MSGKKPLLCFYNSSYYFILWGRNTTCCGEEDSECLLDSRGTIQQFNGKWLESCLPSLSDNAFSSGMNHLWTTGHRQETASRLQMQGFRICEMTGLVPQSMFHESSSQRWQSCRMTLVLVERTLVPTFLLLNWSNHPLLKAQSTQQESHQRHPPWSSCFNKQTLAMQSL